jgi:hypothetical protein
LGEWLATPDCKKLVSYETLHMAMELDRFFGITQAIENR